MLREETSVFYLLLSVCLCSTRNTFQEVTQVWFSLVQWGFSVFVADAHLGAISYQVLRGEKHHKRKCLRYPSEAGVVCALQQDHMCCITQRAAGSDHQGEHSPRPPGPVPRSRRSAAVCCRARWPRWCPLCTGSTGGQDHSKAKLTHDTGLGRRHARESTCSLLKR